MIKLEGKDKVAELLSQGLDPPQIRERMGLSRSAISGYMTRIRADLGVPAHD